MRDWLVLTQETPLGEFRLAICVQDVRAIWDAGKFGTTIGLADGLSPTVKDPFEMVLAWIRERS